MRKDPVRHPSGIEWNKFYLLKWDDFKGKASYKIQSPARASIEFDSHPKFIMLTTRSTFKFRITSVRIKAIFIPDASTVMKDRLTDRTNIALLKHEQGRFDLAEEMARMSNEMYDNKFRDKSFLVKGETLEEAQANSIVESLKITSELLEKLRVELHNEHIQYDRETDYGRNIEKQKEYNNRFDKLRD